MQKLAKLLKLAKMSPVQQHAASDAYKAHMAAPTAPAARPMVRDPHAFAAHQSMMQNPGAYAPQGQVSSGLELATPPRQYKRASEIDNLRGLLKVAFGSTQSPMTPQNMVARTPMGAVAGGLARGIGAAANIAKPPTPMQAGLQAAFKTSELEKLSNMLKDNKSWMPEGKKKKETSGMAGNEDCSKTSEVQKLAELLQKRGGFMQQGMRQLGAAVNNPGMISRGAGKLYNAAGGGLGGVGAVAKHYAPGAAMLAAPIAAGAAGMGLMGGGATQQEQPQNMLTPGFKTGAASTKTAYTLADAVFKGGPTLGAGVGALTAGDDRRMAGGGGQQPDQQRVASYGPEMRKLAGMMQTVGKGIGMAGKAVGIVPGGGTVIGAGLGAVGGAMAAPPGKRMAGAALGGVTGAMGPIAGTVANMAGSRMLGL